MRKKEHINYTQNLDDVLHKEEEYLRKHRTANELTEQADDDILQNKWGICISGGGIRSATLGLGMMQKFMRDHVFKYFDYLSTVSGGGYIGSCMSSLLSEPKKPLVKNAKTIKKDGEPLQLGIDRNHSPFLSRGKYERVQNEYTPKHQLHHLLAHGEYLTRNRSLFSLDIKRFVSAILGGAISNIILLLLMSMIAVSGVLLLFQLIGGDVVLTYRYEYSDFFTTDGSLNWGYLTSLSKGQSFGRLAVLCLLFGFGFAAVYYWIGKSFILDKLQPLSRSEKHSVMNWKRRKVFLFIRKLGKENSPEIRAALWRKMADFWNYLLYMSYEVLSLSVLRKNEKTPLPLENIEANENREDYLVQKVVQNFAILTFVVSALLVAGIILYQRLVFFVDDSIKLIFTLPLFFGLGCLLFMFLLGMLPEAENKYKRVIRSAYTGMYGGAFNTILAALLVPFALLGIFFFDWSGYGLDSPMTLIAPAATYLITAQSGFLKMDAFKGAFQSILPGVRRILFNLSVFVFLFLIFQLLARFIMDPNNEIHSYLRDWTLSGRGNTFLWVFGICCSVFAFLFSTERSLKVILLYTFISVGLIGMLVWINTRLDNFLMERLPLLTVLSISVIALLTGYFFTRKRWALYNTIVLIVAFGVMTVIGLEIFRENIGALKMDLSQAANLNLTPTTYFLLSLLLTLVLGFFFIKRYRGTVLNFYQDRLTEAFLMTDGLVTRIGKRLRKQGQPKKRLRNHEQLLLEDLGENNYKAPYHILLGALNLKSKYVYLRKDLKSEHFIFSKYFIGSKTTGYVSTESYEDDRQKMTLATAMTISAAAVNSAMGSIGFFAQTFLITLFNLRLGKWIKNPLVYAPGAQIAKENNRRVNGITNLLNEYLGNFSTNRRSINVSDGAHTGDNLGLLPLLRRRCSTIVVCDFEEDRNFTFNSLNTVLRMAYVEEGIWIHIDLSDLMPLEEKSNFTKRSVAVGTIYYPNEQRGKIIYIKSSLSGNMATNIYGYQRQNPAFPHQPTSDQFFDSAQYEAYRSLGYDLAEMAVDVIELRREIECNNVIEPDDYLNYLNAQETMEHGVNINGIKQLNYKELTTWIKEQVDFELIDVREEKEHRAFNIGGKNIPLSEVLKRQNEIDYTKPVVFYCKRGIRSVIAIQKLSSKVENANFYNLNRGILDVMEDYSQTNDLEEE